MNKFEYHSQELKYALQYFEPSVVNEYVKHKNSRSIQSHLYLEVTFGTQKKWPYKTGDLLKEVQFV